MKECHINEVYELHAHFILQLRNFFEDYKNLQKQEIKVEEFQNSEITKQILTRPIADYQKEVRPVT